jgi:hypothetical protein
MRFLLIDRGDFGTYVTAEVPAVPVGAPGEDSLDTMRSATARLWGLSPSHVKTEAELRTFDEGARALRDWRDGDDSRYRATEDTAVWDEALATSWPREEISDRGHGREATSARRGAEEARRG